jgi:lipopolysaccharide transport protein LptA
MAASHSKPWFSAYPAAALIAVLVASLALARTAAPPASEVKFEFTGGLELDLKTKMQTAYGVRFTYQDMVLVAAEARGENLPSSGDKASTVRNGSSTFTGDVMITTARSQLRAHSAEVLFRDGRISSAVLTGADGGAPATFEYKLEDSDDVIRGRAQAIEYDVTKETVHLKNKVWLAHPNGELNGESIIYDIRNEKLRADKPGSGRVQPHTSAKEQKPPAP